MSYIQSIASEQTWLLPYSIDELVEENNPVRVIRAYVDSLPMEDLGFVRPRKQAVRAMILAIY